MYIEQVTTNSKYSQIIHTYFMSMGFMIFFMWILMLIKSKLAVKNLNSGYYVVQTQNGTEQHINAQCLFKWI
jgi:hypothetical protein